MQDTVRALASKHCMIIREKLGALFPADLGSSSQSSEARSSVHEFLCDALSSSFLAISCETASQLKCDEHIVRDAFQRCISDEADKIFEFWSSRRRGSAAASSASVEPQAEKKARLKGATLGKT